MKLSFHNTLTGKKELFESIKEDNVSLYSCWPTVYSDPHIWNMRQYVFVDLLKSTLEHVWWYAINHVMNITDVWHLTDDWDQWDDKMLKWAARENLNVWELARKYEHNFLVYSEKLNISKPDVYTRATEYMKEQILMIHTLTEKWYTYEIEWDWIYMDTSKIESYWKLAKLDFEWMNSDHRVDWAKIDSSKKKNLSDFALWKFSKSIGEREMERVYAWSNSWSLLVTKNFDEEIFLKKSKYSKQLLTVRKEWLTELELASIWFPWRHIECSAMSITELGEEIDIHTWWVDHIPVHHTNEIAQSECCLWSWSWVKTWMHWQFVQIDWSKISKSKWDDLSIPWIVKKWFDPLDLRYFYFTAHYRSFLDFTWDTLEASRNSRNNLVKKISQHIIQGWSIWEAWPFFDVLATFLSNDLDIVWVMTCIYEHLSNPSDEIIWSILDFDDVILKLWLRDSVAQVCSKLRKKAPDEVILLAELRFEAKKDRNFTEADAIRDKIIDLWRIVKDMDEWYELEQV